MVCVGPASTTSHSDHNRDGCALARARMSRFLLVEARSVIHAHRWLGQRAQLMLWSKTLSVITSESPALQWALEGSHVDVVRDRMVAEDAVTSCGHKCTWRRGHQISTDPAQEKEITSVDERQADATARRCSCGADLLLKTDTMTAFKKNSSGSGFVTNLQGNIVFR